VGQRRRRVPHRFICAAVRRIGVVADNGNDGAGEHHPLDARRTVDAREYVARALQRRIDEIALRILGRDEEW
jgi:hypothetical protein